MPDGDSRPFDAVLLVSFGGPERPEDVLPFLENVVRGKHVPRQRLLQVAEHYHHFGGKSPINDQNRALIGALEAELASYGPKLPIYWGNRNWHPLLATTLGKMAADGIRRALGLFTSAYSSYSGCRQYLENIAAAQAEVGPSAPRVEKLGAFHDHPDFIAAWIQRMNEALVRLPADCRARARVLYTAHSIPTAMAANCRYEAQLLETCRLVSHGIDCPAWDLVYQSRSGPPTQPWLGPDLADRIRELAATGVRDVVLAPIGFLSDHLEVLYDLDVEAKRSCDDLGINVVRAATVGTHPRVIAMYRQLIVERMSGPGDGPTLGQSGPSDAVCPADCCLPGRS